MFKYNVIIANSSSKVISFLLDNSKILEIIVEKIIDNGADYILAVKENQKQLLQQVVYEFKFSKNIEVDIRTLKNRNKKM